VPGFREQLIRELNMLIQTRWHDDHTTQDFADFLREPSVLANCRVLVWITTEQHFPSFANMPGQIMKVLSEEKQR
jgi:hypothetical protein